MMPRVPRAEDANATVLSSEKKERKRTESLLTTIIDFELKICMMKLNVTLHHYGYFSILNSIHAQ